jgi:bleomycin hydrolase
MALPPSDVKKYAAAFRATPGQRAAKSVLARVGIRDIATDADATVQRAFKWVLDPAKLPVLDQQSSGRCWIFAFTNMIRRAMIKKHKMSTDFRLSQKYIMFFDRIEKCNALLEVLYFVMGSGAGEAPNSLFVSQLRKMYLTDGGTWDFFTGIVQKYGIVPYEDYPDNAQSTNSKDIMYFIGTTILANTTAIGEAARKGNREEFENIKTKTLQACYNIIEAFLGTPPTHVAWQYTDAKGRLQQTALKDITPVEFYAKVVRPLVDVEHYVTLINDPRKPYYKMYSVELLHNIIPSGADNLRRLDRYPTNHYFNVPTDVMRAAAYKSIRGNAAVPFAADMAQFSRIKESRLDLDVHYEDFIGVSAVYPRKMLYENMISGPNHAMLFIGTNGDKGDWQVENSWGVSSEAFPYLTMSDAWFEHYVGEVIVHRKYLPRTLISTYDKLRKQASSGYTFYTFWDVFGNLSIRGGIKKR